MRNVIYVSEPEVIDLQRVKALLPKDYELFLGNATFSGALPVDCQTILIRSETRVTEAIRAHFPQLTSIIRVGSGLDNVDVAYCKKAGIAIYNSPGANADAVSDYIICMTLMALRKVHTVTEEDIESWNRFKFTGHSLSNRTIGLIGFGNIGKLVHKKLQAFGCKDFNIYDPFLMAEDVPSDAHYVLSIESIFMQCDVISLGLQLTKDTKYIVDKKILSYMRPEAVLINASRGGIVNETDLISATKDIDFTYIADTVENEPHVSRSLINAENVIITPHVGSLTEESQDNMITYAIRNFLEGSTVDEPHRTLSSVL